VSVYVHAQQRKRGLGRRLYTALFELLRLQGFYSAYAGIALPNEASVQLHEALGFVPIGVYRAVGYKLGAWRDVGWWQCDLLPHRPDYISAW
jgi:phosphinothricin acetyltransferase